MNVRNPLWPASRPVARVEEVAATAEVVAAPEVKPKTQFPRMRELPAPKGLPPGDLVALAEDAAKALGYPRLKDYLINRQAKAEDNQRLLGALSRLGYMPFDREAVEKYKHEMLARHNKDYSMFDWSWQQSSLSGFKGQVPVRALRLAVALKKELHNVEISVVSLMNRIRVNDPFLIVKLGESDQFYVEVWDEPGFEIQY